MRTSRRVCCLLVIVVNLQLAAQSKFNLVPADVVETRLGLYGGNDQVRETTLVKLFRQAGCPASSLSEQIVPTRKEPNVICVLPGETAEQIVIGAHFDHSSEGGGVLDNWSGASLLPSLLESSLGTKRKYTLVFIGFTGEESGEIGSNFYIGQLSKSEVSRIQLMLTIDSVGAGPTKVWVSRSDPRAVGILAGVGRFLSLPVAGMNVDGVGESDEEAFRKRKVKTITIHSLTDNTIHLIHSTRDSPKAIRFSDYYDTYHLLAAFLAVLDVQLGIQSPSSSLK